MKAKLNVRSMVQASFFAALSIILTRLVSIMVTPTLRLGLGELPLIMSGILFGPIIGAATGFVADMIGFMINPQGVFHLGFTISSILWGMIPGLISINLMNKKDFIRSISLPKVLIIVAISRIIIAVGLNTYWLSQLFGKAYIVLFFERVIFSAIQIPIESYIITKIIEYIQPVLNFE